MVRYTLRLAGHGVRWSTTVTARDEESLDLERPIEAYLSEGNADGLRCDDDTDLAGEVDICTGFDADGEPTLKTYRWELVGGA